MVVSNSSVPDFPAIMLGLENPTGVKLNSHKHKLKHRFEIVRKLGQGTYGKVQLAVNRETGQEVAIKTIKKAKIETEQDLVRIRREIQIMSSVQHPSIIHIYEVFENREKMILVMEYAAGGELYDYLSDRKVLAEEEARRIFRQISAAVYYCHKHKICHRDLKLENILLDDKGNAKIADFGLSNVFDGKNCLNTFCGSPLYASPEIVKGIPYYGPEVDCWSLGVLLYTLVYGAMPFDGSNFKRLVKQITGGDYFEPNKKSEASELIRCILTVSPKRRADIEDICSHWWVNEGYSISCLEVADELACQTPVRLDLLLSLAPAPKSAEKLVIDKPAGEEAGGKEEEKVEGATAAAAGVEMELEGAVGGPIEVVKNQKPAKNGKPPSSPEASKAVENFAKDLSTGSLKGAEPSMASTVRGAEAAPPAKKPMTRHLSLTSKHAKEKIARLEESDPSLPLPTPPPTPPAASVGGSVPEVQQPSLPSEKTSAKLETGVPEVQPKEKKVKKVKKVETEAQSELSVPAVAAESRKKDEEVAVATPQPSEPIVEPEKPPIEKVSTKEEQPTPFEQPGAAKPTTIDGSDTSSVASSTATATPKKKVVKKVIKSKVPKAATKEVEKPESEVERKASSPEKRTSPPSPAVKKSATAKAGTTTTTTMEEKPSATIVRRSSKNISETAKAFDVANGSTAVPSKIPSSVGSGSKTLERPKKLVLPGLSNIRDAKKAFEVKESAVDKPKPLVLPSRTVSDAKRRFEVTGGGTGGAVAAVGKPPVAPTSGGATKSKTEGRISSVPFAEKIAKIVAKTKEKTPPKIEKKEPKVKQKSPPLAKNKGKVKEEEKEKAEVGKVTEEKTDVEKSQPVPALVLAEEKPSSSTSNGEHGKVVREQKKASLKGTLKAAATAKTTKSPAVDTSKPPEGCKTVMMEVSPNVTVEATMRIDSGEPAPAMIAKPAPAAKGLPTTASSGTHGLHRPPPLPPPSSSTMSSGASNAKSAEIPGSETSFLRKATTPGPAEPATVTSPQRRSFVATVSTSSTSSMPTVLIPFTSTSALTPPTPTREDSVTPTPSELPRAPSPILAVSATARVTSPTATPTAEVAPAPIHVRSISAPVRHMFSPPPPAVLPPRAPSVGKERLVPIFLADSDVPVSSYQQQQQQQQKPMQQQREGSIGRSFFTSPLERRDSSRSERDWSEASSVSGRQTPAPAPAPARAGAAAGTTAAGGLKHSRREYIIPIALEDGGFASAPSTASATPTPSTASTMSSPFFHERSATPAVGTTSGEGAVGGSSDMFGTFGRGAMGSSRTSSGRRMWSLFNEEETPSLGNMRLQRLSSFGKSMPTSNAAYKSATKSAGSSSHPKSRFKSTIDRSDSFSSAGEEDDDEEGFEILTAESLFSTLLERVRNLSRRMNKDDSLFSRINSPLVSGPSETPASSTASRQESPSPWSTDSNWPLHTRYGSSSAGQQRAPKTPVRTNSLKSTYATSGVALATGGAGSSSGRTTPTGSMMASATLPRSGWASPAAYFRSSLKNYDDPHSSEGYDPARRKESDTQSCYSDSAALPTSSYQGRNNPPRQSESPPPSASSVGPEATASLARRVANYFSRAPSYELHSIKENESGGLRSRHLGAGDSAPAMARRAQQAYTAAGDGGTGNNVDHPGSTSGLKYGRTGRAKTAGSLLPSASSSGEEEGAAAGGARQPQKQRTTSSSFRPESRYSMYLSGTADDSAASSAGMSASSSINKAMSKSTYGGDFGLGSSSRPDSAVGDFSSSSIGASGYQTLPRSGFQRPVSMIDPQPIAGSRDFSKSQYLTPSSEDSSMPSRRDAKRYTGNLSDSWQSTADLMSSSASGGLPPGVSNNSANNRDAARRISSYLNDALRRHGAGYTSTINLSAPPSVIASGTRSVVSDGPPSTSAGNSSSSNKMSTYNPDLSSDFNSSNNFSAATLGRPSRRITVTGAPPPVAGSKRWSTMMNYGAGGFNPQEPFVGSILPKLEESLMMNSMPSSGNKVNGSSGSRSAQLVPAADVGFATAELAGPMLRDPPAADSWSANHLPVVGSNGNQDQTDTCSVSASSDVSDLDNSISSCIDGESVSERILRKSYYSRFNDSLSRRRSASTHPKISSSSLSAASSISKLMGSSFENLAASSSAGGIPAGKKKASKSRTETSVDKVGEPTGLPRSGGEKARIRHASRDRAAGGPSAGKSGSSSGTKKKTNSAAGSGELPTISHKGGDSSSRTEVHGSVTRV